MESPKVNTERLYATTDASVWAEEFAKIEPDVDESLMISWFANAIETAKSLTSSTKDQRVVYQSTPDVYEFELRNILQVIEEVSLALGRCEDVWLEHGELVLWSKNDYPIGRLHLDDDQWVFTPRNESDVPVDEL